MGCSCSIMGGWYRIRLRWSVMGGRGGCGSIMGLEFI